MEKISIIVPVYQAKEYLQSCVDSILAQSDKGWELLLIDDASTDGSALLCDRLAAMYPQIRAVHCEHGGAAAARNRGVKEAGGSLIAFIDSDDTVDKDYLEYLRALLAANDAQIAVCAHTPQPRDAKTVVYRNGEALPALLYQQHFMSVPWGMLSKRQLWDSVSFPEGTEAEDMGTIYRLFMAADTVVWGPKAAYHYLQHSSSTIYSTSSSRRIAYFKHSREMVKTIRSLRPEYTKAAVSRHFSTCAQDLSETPLNSREGFLRRLYKDMKQLAPRVADDSSARTINRGAALIAKLSPRLVHALLRSWYRIKIWRMDHGSDKA